MNIYGTGPPRSGTTMLAKCLSVVKETHHECGVSKDMLSAWSSPEEYMHHTGHESEVAFWYTPLVHMFDGKIIHLWRPVNDWLRSMMGRFPPCQCTDPKCYAHKGFDRGRWGTPSAISYLNLYKGYHMTLLDLGVKRDIYVVQPSEIQWEDLLDYLEWPYTDKQITKMYAIQNKKPNKGTPDDHGIKIDEAANSIESVLRFKSRRPK